MSEAIINCIGAVNNPDISGIGVRISFYLQNILLVLVVTRSWSDAPPALGTFISTSFGLTIAAIVQLAQGHLSLFQAFQVSNLVWLANFGTFLSLAAYSRRRAKHDTKVELRKSDNFIQLGAIAQTIFSMILTLYLWGKVDTFGNQQDCRPVVRYVIFVVDFRPLGAGKIVGLTISSLMFIIYLPVTVYEMWTFQKLRGKEKQCEHRELLPEANDYHLRCDSMPLPVTTPLSVSSPSTKTTTDPTHHPPNNFRLQMEGVPYQYSIFQSQPESPIQEKLIQERDNSDRPKPKRWLSSCDPVLLGIGTFQIVISVYFIVSSEVLLKCNPDPSNTAAELGFGQILALMAVVPAIIAAFGAFREKGLGRLNTRKKKPSRNETKQEGQWMVPGGSIRMCQNESFIIEAETSGASQGNRSPEQLENGMCEEIEVACSSQRNNPTQETGSNSEHIHGNLEDPKTSQFGSDSWYPSSIGRNIKTSNEAASVRVYIEDFRRPENPAKNLAILQLTMGDSQGCSLGEWRADVGELLQQLQNSHSAIKGPVKLLCPDRHDPEYRQIFVTTKPGDVLEHAKANPSHLVISALGTLKIYIEEASERNCLYCTECEQCRK